MCVDHRRADIGVAEQFLDRTDVGSAFQQMCGLGMSERLAADTLGQPSFTRGLGDGALHDRDF